MSKITWASEADRDLALDQLRRSHGTSVACEVWDGDGRTNHDHAWAETDDLADGLSEGGDWPDGTTARIVGTDQDGAALLCYAECERIAPVGGEGYEGYRYWVVEVYREPSGCDRGTLELYYIPDGGW